MKAKMDNYMFESSTTLYLVEECRLIFECNLHLKKREVSANNNKENMVLPSFHLQRYMNRWDMSEVNKKWD